MIEPLRACAAEQALDHLVALYDENLSENRLTVATVESPTGWGKSTVVESFYESLVEELDRPRYWPRELGWSTERDARKRLYPRTLAPEPGARVDLLWWGLRGQLDGDDPRPALFDADQQLGAIAAPIAEALDFYDARWGRRVRALRAVGGLALPGLTRVLDVSERLLRIKEQIEQAKGQVEQARDLLEVVTGAVTSGHQEVDRALTAVDSADPLARFRTQRAVQQLETTARMLRQVSRVIPLVVAVEDAQLLDAHSLQLLRSLANGGSARGLIVLTIATDRTLTDDTLARWLTELSARRVLGPGWMLKSKLLDRIELAAPTTDELSGVVGDRLAEDDGDVGAADLDPCGTEVVVRHAAGSLLRLHELLDSAAVRRALRRGDPQEVQLASDRVAAHDRQLRDEWRALPAAMRAGLSIAATVGQQTPDDWLAGALSLVTDAPGTAALLDGTDWLVRVEHIDATTVSFANAASGAFARAAAADELTGTEIDAVRHYATDRVRAAHADDSWKMLPTDVRFDLLTGVSGHDVDAERAVELAELQVAALRPAGQRRRVLDYLVSAAARDGAPLITTIAAAGGLLDLADSQRAIDLLRSRHAAAHGHEAVETGLQLARTHAGLGHYVDALAVLDDVGAALEPDSPSRQAIQDELVEVLYRLREWDRLRAATAARLAAALDSDGTSSSRAVDALYQHCHGRTRAGRPDEALAALDQFESQVGSSLPGALALDVRCARAEALHALPIESARHQAIVLLRDVVATATLAYDVCHPSLVTYRDRLAASYAEDGYRVESAVCYRQLADDLEHELGPEHPQTLSARHFEASSLMELAELVRAEELLRQVMEVRVRVLGPDHPHVGDSEHVLADCMYRAGRHEEAIVMVRRAISVQTRSLGARHPASVGSRHLLVTWLDELGRDDDAITELEQVVADRRALYGDLDEATLGPSVRLAGLYARVGRTADAIGAYRAALVDVSAAFGPDDPKTIMVRGDLAALVATPGGL